MTTIAMVAGMLPSALAFGAGGEFRAPMAIAVIAGLIVSTFLSLLFVPAFFAMMDDCEGGIRRVFSRLMTGGPGRSPAPAHDVPAGEHPGAAAPHPAPGE
jgi:hypothetical protein